jgi:hypothetical protein
MAEAESLLCLTTHQPACSLLGRINSGATIRRSTKISEEHPLQLFTTSTAALHVATVIQELKMHTYPKMSSQICH